MPLLTVNSSNADRELGARSSEQALNLFGASIMSNQEIYSKPAPRKASNLLVEQSADFMNMSNENSDSSAPNESIAAKEDQSSTYMASDEDQDGYDQKYGEDSEEMRRRVAEMEEELLKISNMQQQVERQINSAADKIDENSIYVGQVDYEATPEELRAHFAPCGTLNRITIVCDKITGHPKGFAYIEFSNKESVDNALKLDDTLFKGRQLKVLPKRQNIPMSVGRGRGRGRFGGGAGRGRFPSGGRFAPGGRAPGRFGGGGRRGGASFRGRGGTGYHAAAYY